MNIEAVVNYCLSKLGATEGFPFGEDVLVFKVCGKMFAAMGLERRPLGINLKCDPAKALELRASHEEVQPAWHMNKKHWNTVVIEGNLSKSEIKEMIDDSYDLVVSKLTKKDREKLAVSS